jgi:hypothetical protein
MVVLSMLDDAGPQRVTVLATEDAASLTLAMHVALPIVERMIRNALEAGAAAGRPRPARTPESATRTQHADGVPVP